MMFNNTNFLKSLRLMLLGVFMLPLLYSQSSAQYCSASTTSWDEYIGEFYFNTIEQTDDNWSKDISDYTSMSTTVMKGKSYTASVYNPVKYASDYVRLWIDFNQDYKFDTSTEEFVLSSTDGGSNFSGSVTIPMSASEGSTRLRVRMTYATTPLPCDGSSYGEVEDYTVNIIPPLADGLVSAMTSPVKPYLVGNYPVIVTLKSNSADMNLASAKIDWWVNNVFQGTIQWSGNLPNGYTANVNMGNFDFSYPQGEVEFKPFQMKFTVRDVNGKNPDLDPNNDTYMINTTPSLNDCGPIGFFGPPEGFGAGVTPVRARILNYAPKPLSSVTVNWKIDGITQTPKTFTGLSIQQNTYQDLDLGTFLFYNKTPLGPFTVEVWTEKPNGVADEDTQNDSYAGGIGPSLAAGTYYAGGANAHFISPSEAASYLNSSGVFGHGTVIVEIRPGTYYGPIVLNNALANDNSVIFRSSTGMAYDVTISNSPSSVTNYVVQVANINNIRFENLTFHNGNSNVSNAGRIFDVNNVDGMVFNKVVFNGVANSPKTAAYNLITLNNSSHFTSTGSDYNNGSVGIWNSSTSASSMDVDGNDFMNFTWYGIYNQLNPPSNNNDVNITNNTFKRTLPGNVNGAIYSFNGSSISNNMISDIIGSGNANDAFIRVEHSIPNSAHTAWIENNIITNCSNMNGIKVNNAYTVINRNMIVMSQSANFGAALIDLTGAAGAVGNNMMMGSNIMGFDFENAPLIYAVYNTASVEFNANPVVRVTGLPAHIMRNVFLNKGNGTAIQSPTANDTIDQNVIWSNGANLANIGGMNYADMTAIHNAGMMMMSNQLLVEFFSPSDPHLKVYNAALLYETPMFNEVANLNAWYVESNDYDNEARSSYYAGADEIFLSIFIERQTDGFVDCVGATDNILTVSAAIGYNAPMTYQWEHDNVPVPGETEPILYFKNLRHQQAGVYRCLVNGPGNTEPTYSHEVAVYVTRPTDIIRQPQTQGVFLGEVATLSFDAHVNGKDIESAIANDEVKVRWYKYVDEATSTPLVDNLTLSGTKSNYFTIRNFRASDEGSYYAIIDGLCGSVKTEMATLTESSLDIEIIQQPIDREDCIGKEVILMVNASTKSSINILYQWYKDGNIIVDNLPKIEGSQSKNLIIYNLQKADEGNYYAVVTLEGTTVKAQSITVGLKAFGVPTISLQPQDQLVESGKQLTLDVLADGSYEGEVLTYKWYKNNVLVQNSDDQYYIVDVTTPDDAGDYYVIVENPCGNVRSETITVTITTSTTSVVEVSKNGYSLSTATPNPVQNNSMISFSVPTESFVKITLTDASASGSIVLAEGNYSTGTYQIDVNAVKHNLASGTYFYYLEANGIRLAQKLVVIR